MINVALFGVLTTNIEYTSKKGSWDAYSDQIGIQWVRNVIQSKEFGLGLQATF